MIVELIIYISLEIFTTEVLALILFWIHCVIIIR